MRKSIKANTDIIDNLRRVFQAINENSRYAEKTTGLTGPQLWALKILENASPIRVSELAQRMYLRSATVVGILDRLELKGLVSRARSTDDRRAVDLYLTEMGKQLADKAPEVAQVMLVKGLDELTDEQFSVVEEGMKLMVSMLEAEHMTPQPLHG
jgi:DNA-binding MarR family transcriptional regulator